ncbi:MAG TPA: hypothetical protein VK157_06420 [Phycisphaerales bacterium]|nr:hypothetical protein [Phycisphaerales bacterium]
MTRIVLSLVLLLQALGAPWLSLHQRDATLEAVAKHIESETCCCCEACDCGCDACPMTESLPVRSGGCRCVSVTQTPVAVVMHAERKRDPPARREMAKSRGPAAFVARVALHEDGCMRGVMARGGIAQRPIASCAWTGKRTT